MPQLNRTRLLLIQLTLVCLYSFFHLNMKALTLPPSFPFNETEIRHLISYDCREAARQLAQLKKFRGHTGNDEEGMPLLGSKDTMKIKQFLRLWLRLSPSTDKLIRKQIKIRPSFIHQILSLDNPEAKVFQMAHWLESLSSAEAPEKPDFIIFFSSHFIGRNPYGGISLPLLAQRLRALWGKRFVFEVLPQNVVEQSGLFIPTPSYIQLPWRFAENFQIAQSPYEVKSEASWIEEMTAQFQASRVGVNKHDAHAENPGNARLLAQAVFAAAEREELALFVTSDFGVYFPLLSYARGNQRGVRDLGFSVRTISDLESDSEIKHPILELHFQKHFNSRLYLIIVGSSPLLPMEAHSDLFERLLSRQRTEEEAFALSP